MLFSCHVQYKVRSGKRGRNHPVVQERKLIEAPHYKTAQKIARNKLQKLVRQLVPNSIIFLNTHSVPSVDSFWLEGTNSS